MHLQLVLYYFRRVYYGISVYIERVTPSQEKLEILGVGIESSWIFVKTEAFCIPLELFYSLVIKFVITLKKKRLKLIFTSYYFAKAPLTSYS